MKCLRNARFVESEAVEICLANRAKAAEGLAFPARVSV